MDYREAILTAAEFWAEPEDEPFPGDVQATLLSSDLVRFRHVGAMSVVYNGLLAFDEAYIDSATEILWLAAKQAAPTAERMTIARDLSYMPLFRAITNSEENPNYGAHAQAAFRTVLDLRGNLANQSDFSSGEASGVLSEALVVALLNQAQFDTIPSYPWQDWPAHSGDRPEKNQAFDALVLNELTSKTKIQVKSSDRRPPKSSTPELQASWPDLGTSERRQIIEATYADDIAVIVVNTDLSINVARQMAYFNTFNQGNYRDGGAWLENALNAVTEAVW